MWDLAKITSNTVYAADASNLAPSAVLDKTTALIFNLMMWGGIIIAAAGVIQIVRALASGGDSDPHSLSRGISLVIGGVIMIVVRSVITAIIGQDPARIVYIIN